MLKWLKFTFGSFFSNSLSKEGAKRSFWNVVFSLFICFIIMLSFLSAGFNYSIATHYDAATDFRKTAYNIFANETVSNRVELNVKTVQLKDNEGKEYNEVMANATKNGETIVINTFENETDAKLYKLYGYDVIIDTRPSNTTFYEFSVSYYLKSDESHFISADQYRALEDKSEYTGEVTIHNMQADPALFRVDVNGNGINDSEDVTYTTGHAYNFLEEYTKDLADDNKQKAEFKKLKELDVNSSDYINGIYSLFVRAYYQLEDTPTNLIYYERYYGYSTETKTYPKKNFFLLTDIFSIVSFTTDDNVDVLYEGYYTQVADGSFYYPTNENNLQAIYKSIDVFFIAIFNSVSSINTLSIGINVFSFYPYIIIAMALFGLLLYCICKLKNRPYADKFIGGFKIVSSYLPISASLAGIVSMICFFFMNSASAYGIGCWGLLSIIGFRTLILVIGEEIAYKKNPLRDNVVKVSPVIQDKYEDTLVDENKENLDLSNVESSTKIITNDVDDDEDEKMELM